MKNSNTRLSTKQATLGVQKFQAFYRENLGPIYRYVYSKMGNREEAEDLTSQIFMKALCGMDEERDSHSMRKWLFQVARTTIADYWRVQYCVATSSLEVLLTTGWEATDEDEPVETSNESAECVQRILQALRQQYQEVLTCRFLLGFSARDTAVKMGLSEGNVRVVQFRALKCAADLEGIVSGDAPL